MVSTSAPSLRLGAKWPLVTRRRAARDDAEGAGMSYAAYILRSEASGTYYKGSCEDLNQRLAQHNQGRVRSTRAKGPWTVCYVEEFPTRGEAIQRERFFKARSGYRWLKRKGIL